jgi:hypothetical protein
VHVTLKHIWDEERGHYEGEGDEDADAAMLLVITFLPEPSSKPGTACTRWQPAAARELYSSKHN